MSRVTWSELAGWPLLILDFSRAVETEESLRWIAEAKAAVTARAPAPSSLLTLTLVTDSRFDRTVLRGLQDLMAHDRPFVRAGAVVGLSGLQRVAYNTLVQLTGRRNLVALGTREEAERWLRAQVSQPA